MNERLTFVCDEELDEPEDELEVRVPGRSGRFLVCLVRNRYQPSKYESWTNHQRQRQSKKRKK